MSGTNEEVERKANPDAEGVPGAQEPQSATGDMLTDTGLGLPSPNTVAPLLLALFLFGGVVLVIGGVTLWVMANLGPYVTVAVHGLGWVLIAVLLAQVFARRGWI